MTRDFRQAKITSVLSEGSELEGRLHIKGGIRIDGKVQGEIWSESVVYVGEAARVQADIVAEAVFSSGRIDGDISAARHVEISLPGRIKGDIETRQLVLERGVFFDGTCRLIESD